MSWDEVTHAFFAAAEAFDRLLEAPEITARWEEPSALDGYTVGAIVGHVNAALAWTEPMLDSPEPSDLRPIRLGNYYAGLKITEEARHPIHDILRDMSEKAAGFGPAATADRLRALVDRLRLRLAGERGDRILDMRPAVPAAVRLDDFLLDPRPRTGRPRRRPRRQRGPRPGAGLNRDNLGGHGGADAHRPRRSRGPRRDPSAGPQGTRRHRRVPGVLKPGAQAPQSPAKSTRSWATVEAPGSARTMV